MSAFIDVHCHLYDVSHIPMITLLDRYGTMLSWGLKDVGGLNPFHEKVHALVETCDSTTFGILERLLNQIREFLADKPADTSIILTPLVIYFEKEDRQKSLDRQANDLKEAIQKIYAQPENSDVLIYPFIGVDPMLQDTIDIVKHYVKRNKDQIGAQNGEFIGVKVYSPLNVDVSKPSAIKLFEHCELNDIPITTHGSEGGFISENIGEDRANELSHPGRWAGVLQQFPNLRVNFAHFGGLEPEWMATIKSYIQNGHPNVYTDVAYQLAAETEDCGDAVNEWMEHPDLASRLLFGTDYYSVMQEEPLYKDYATPFKNGIGSTNFNALSNTNPRAFLRL